MNENGYNNQQGSMTSFDDGYADQSINNPYGAQQNPTYGSQGNAMPSGTLYDNLTERLPDGMMDKLPRAVTDRIEGALSEAEEKMNNPYERVDTNTKQINLPPWLAITAAVLIFGGTILFASFYPIAVALCWGIALTIFGGGAVADKNFKFQRDAFSMVLLIPGIFLTILSAYVIISDVTGALPQISAAVGAGAGCIVLGSSILIFSGLSSGYLKKACTQTVQAKCVYIREKRESNSNGRVSMTYSPVFEFWFGGQTHCVSENYGNVSVPTLGETYDLHINPQEPTEFYRNEKKSKGIIVFVCLIFIAAGVFAIVSSL